MTGTAGTEDEYPARAATCLRQGHQPIVWRMLGTQRVLCGRCGRTWPFGWLRLITMANIEPISGAAA